MRLKHWLRRILISLEQRLRPKPQPVDQTRVIMALEDRLLDQTLMLDSRRRDYVERAHELVEAHAMRGTGPWLPEGGKRDLKQLVGLRESNPVSAQGSMGDLELALQNIEWRREVQLSWLEFSRWGIQQIILISRLYYTKNPIIRRLINVDAYYVFGRGVEISSDDSATNDAIKEFLKLNDSQLGQVALSEHQKRTNYDGNLFFVFFPDRQDSGAVPIRTIDATEIQDIITNPEDTDEKWYFRRTWSQRDFDPASGQTKTTTKEAWYPAIGYDPKPRPTEFNGNPIMWDQPVYHRKYGAVGKWLFGCPVIYPALDWAKAARRYLEACTTLADSLAQFSMKLTTKGGQQALAGVKQQLSTTVGPNTAIWDQNPTAVTGSVFASGPGTVLDAFHSRGQGLDPSEVKQLLAMCAICMDVPPTFVGDLETSNLATATTLDRPTELAFMHKQEAWRETLVTVFTFALTVQLRAAGGKLREALGKKFSDLKAVRIVEAPRTARTYADGSVTFRYMTAKERIAAGNPKKETDIEIKVTFPSIREGDIPALITAVTEAMTLGNTQGQVVGIDERAGVLKLFELAGIEGGEELAELMYPLEGKDKYDPNRTKEPPEPAPPAADPTADPTPGQKEAMKRFGLTAEKLKRIIKAREARKKAA